MQGHGTTGGHFKSAGNGKKETPHDSILSNFDSNYTKLLQIAFLNGEKMVKI